MRSTQGFTLIELLITLVVAAILAALAIPAYQNNVDRGRRAVAVNALTELHTAQQGFQLKRRRFATDFEPLVGIKGDTLYLDASKRMTLDKGSEPLYEVKLELTGGIWSGFSATAVGVQDRDTDCASFRVAADGLQSAVDDGGADTTGLCWR